MGERAEERRADQLESAQATVGSETREYIDECAWRSVVSKFWHLRKMGRITRCPEEAGRRDLQWVLASKRRSAGFEKFSEAYNSLAIRGRQAASLLASAFTTSVKLG